MLFSYSLLLVPFLFAFLDRLRGTDSQLKVGNITIGNSVWYSSSVGIISGYCFNDWRIGFVIAILFEFGERRNWQEIGYFLLNPKDFDVWFELIARSAYWYVPSICALFISGHIAADIAIVSTILSLFIMLVSLIISKTIFRFKAIENNNEWSLGEYIRGFLWGALLSWIIYAT